MSAVLVSYGMDCRVTDVLRPPPGRGEVLVRIAANSVDLLGTRIFDGAAGIQPSRFQFDRNGQ
jgi:NADPH:quinone reductase-like Zn-dependent oxidoreductase